MVVIQRRGRGITECQSFSGVKFFIIFIRSLCIFCIWDINLNNLERFVAYFSSFRVYNNAPMTFLRRNDKGGDSVVGDCRAKVITELDTFDRN